MRVSIKTALLCQMAAFWPVWRWYALRVNDSPEDAWGAASLAAALALLLRERNDDKLNRPAGWIPVAGVIGYAALFPLLPPILRAAVAVASLGITFRSAGMSGGKTVQIFGLGLLSLPVIPSLQFYLGYPLRIVVGAVTARLLNLAGFSAVQEGTGLVWRGQTIWIDAPCTGIKMIWALLFLSLLLAATMRMNARQSIVMVLCASVAAMAGNVVRMSSLFLLESGRWSLPGWAHGGTGVVSLLLAGAAIVWISRWMPRQEMTPCDPGDSFSFPAR